MQHGDNIITVDNEMFFDGLTPNTVYFISILPRGVVDNIDVSLNTTWVVQTFDAGVCVCSVV